MGGGGLLTFSAFRMGGNSRWGAYSNKYGMHIQYLTPRGWGDNEHCIIQG